MPPRQHIFCVPFIGAGHGVNMCNVAMLLATPQIQTHVIVPSEKSALKWMKATGQQPNPNVHIEVVANGKWENWYSEDARELVGFFTSMELAESVGTKMTEIAASHEDEPAKAVIFNGMMMNLIAIYKAQNLKGFLLGPSPYYMSRLASAICEGDTADTEVIYQGIGGSDKQMTAKLGDVVSFFGPMMKIFSISMSSVDGLIYSNTNTGLEGNEYKQPQMKDSGSKQATEYMIGPILPDWLEQGLDRPELINAHLKEFSNDTCIKFMNQQKDKSVVYIALGSHCQLSINQVEIIITHLRKTNTKWILLDRVNTEAVITLLGSTFGDGIVTPWAPQVEIMVHPALKCVISHGGFGTMIEGIFAGVPFITAPVASDQFLDTRVMTHLGICVGCIAEFTHEDAIASGRLVPVFPSDDGKAITKLFGHIFGSEQGEHELEKARVASRQLRRRMLDAKAESGAEQLRALIQSITS